ncbi:AAA family ATPase [Candidatus Woesearchaeota archaeon]|nr:AAA family ATPase [Candidatus Woesearchaeota archaeon]
MAIQKTIDEKTLEDYQRRSNVKYSSLYNALVSNSQRAEQTKELRRGELSDIVSKYSKLFSSVLHSVEDALKTESLINEVRNKDEFIVQYSAYVASRVVTKDLEALIEPNHNSRALLLSNKKLKEKELIPRDATEYKTIRVAFDNLIAELSESKQTPQDATIDFFTKYSNRAESLIRTNQSRAVVDKIKDINWVIGSYAIDGLKPVVKRENGVKLDDINNREKGQFYTPLRPLSIPEEKVLPKERIVGDQNVMTYLERMVKALFLYSPENRRNPMKEKKKFTNKILLQGLPGGGKGAVSFYIADYTKKLGEKLGRDLMVTNFQFDSSYEDGKIQKLKSQFHQITTDNRLFLIYQDEIDGILKNESPGLQKKSDLQVIQEFNKFLDGQYPDKGNYLLLANLNDINNLSKANRRRFYEINWRGATTEEQKTKLLSYKLEDGVSAGYVQVNDRELKKLGELAYENNLTGADITMICEKVTTDSFKWEKISDIYKMNGNYEEQLALIDRNHTQVGYKDIEREMSSFVDHKTRSSADSEMLYEN